MPWYKCLKCGHRKYVAEGEATLIQCTNYRCRSYWMMPEEAYERIVENLANVVNDGMPVLNTFSAIVEILRANGISGQPLKTLQMVHHLVKEAEERKKLRQVKTR